MGSNLAITKEIENYINNHSLELTAVQKEIISSKTYQIDTFRNLFELTNFISMQVSIFEFCLWICSQDIHISTENSNITVGIKTKFANSKTI